MGCHENPQPGADLAVLRKGNPQPSADLAGSPQRKSATKCGFGWFSAKGIHNWARIWLVLRKGNPQLRCGLRILRKTSIKLHLGILA